MRRPVASRLLSTHRPMSASAMMAPFLSPSTGLPSHRKKRAARPWDRRWPAALHRSPFAVRHRGERARNVIGATLSDIRSGIDVNARIELRVGNYGPPVLSDESRSIAPETFKGFGSSAAIFNKTERRTPPDYSRNKRTYISCRNRQYRSGRPRRLSNLLDNKSSFSRYIFCSPAMSQIG
jgi:hypothetical protein